MSFVQSSFGASPASTGPPASAGAAASFAGTAASFVLCPGGVPGHLECTGLYQSLRDKTVAPEARPFRPGVEFWSDGAEKTRWVSLPAGAKIDVSSWNDWVYPVGIKLWKEFKIGGKRIETRLYTKLATGWAHAVYRWNADETDAVRKDDGEKLAGLGPDGGTYEIPATDRCDQCHRGRKDKVLGLDAIGSGLATASGQTLAKMASDGWLSATPPATTLAFPGSEKAQKALGWLNANCGFCHNPNPDAMASFRVHLQVRATQLAPGAQVPQLDPYLQGYCKDSTRSEPGTSENYKLIRGGAPTRSLTSVLSGRRTAPDPSPQQMPPIVSRAVDQQGHQLLDDWINELPACAAK